MTAQLREFARVRWAFTVAVVALVGALAVQTVNLGAAPVAETPVTANLQINVTTATDDLEAGDVVTFDVQSANGVTISGVEAKLCNIGPPPTLAPAFTSYDTDSYGYSGTNVRCVRGIPFNGTQGIITGGLDADAATDGVQPPTYRIDPQVQAPGTTQTAAANFTVGTGSVVWVNAAGNQGTMECGPDAPCAMVVKVDHTGAAGTTFYIQQLVFAGGTAVTTTTSVPGSTVPTTAATTTTSTTTTTSVPSSTTTSTPATTTTSAPSSSSTSTPAITGVAGGGTGTGSSPLAFTGTSTRDLVSIALVMLAVGLFILGETQRRRSRT